MDYPKVGRLLTSFDPKQTLSTIVNRVIITNIVVIFSTSTGMIHKPITIKLLAAVLLLSTAVSSNAQLTAPGNQWSGLTEYQLADDQDPIFVFFDANNITLQANLPDTLLPATFAWEKYNPGIFPDTLDHRFELYTTHTDTTQSVLTGIPATGYRIRITPDSIPYAIPDSVLLYAPDSIPTFIPDSILELMPHVRIETNIVDSIPTLSFVFIAWVMVDDVEIEDITYDNNCNELKLDVTTVPDIFTILYEKFTYFDLSSISHTEISKLGIQYEGGIRWEASEGSINVPDVSSTGIRISPPPLWDAFYTVSINSPFERTFTYETEEIPAVATKAEFTINGKSEEIEGEALFEMELKSESINADSLFWYLINDELNIFRGADSILWRDSSDYTNRIYAPLEQQEDDLTKLMVPGVYTVEHIAKKRTEINEDWLVCCDTLAITVKVDSSLIAPESIPNAFTPGSSDNNIFKFIEQGENDAYKSLKEFSISIYSRWGKLVHQFGPADVNDWEGWDGTIRGTSREAANGVYYYVIDATGWDGKRFRRRQHRGFVYLFRAR